MKSKIMPSSFALLVALLAVLAVADNVLRTDARQFEGAKMSWDMKSFSEPDPDRATPRIKPLPINPPVTSRDHMHGGQHNDVGKAEPSIEQDVLDRATPRIQPVPVSIPPVISWDHIHGGQQERNQRQCQKDWHGHCFDPKKISNPPIHIHTMRLRRRASRHPVQIIPGSATGGQHIDVGKPEISSIEPDVLDRAKPRIKTVPYPLKGEQIHAGQHNDVGKAESSIEPNKGCMRPSPHCH